MRVQRLLRSVICLPFLFTACLSNNSGTPSTSPSPTLPPNNVVTGAFNPARGFDGAGYAIAMVGDGTDDAYVIAGSIYTNASIGSIARVTAQGTINTTFNSLAFTGTPTYLAASKYGQVYVGGSFSQYGTTPVHVLCRLNSDGNLDSSFSVGTNLTSVKAVIPLTDESGRIYVLGNYSYNSTTLPVVRLNVDGSLDTTFALGTLRYVNSLVSPPVTEAATVSAIAIDSNENLYITGMISTFNGTSIGNLFRVTSAGALDSNFSPVTFGSLAVPTALAVAPGSLGVYVGFSSSPLTINANSTSYALFRIETNGALDTAFTDNAGFTGYAGINSLTNAVDGSEQLYVSGSSVIRLNSSGIHDTAWSTGTGFDGTINAVTPTGDSEGEILVAGGFYNYNGTGIIGFARLTSTGTLTTGNPTGSGFDQAVLAAIAPKDTSGSVYVAGSFAYYNGKAVPPVTKILSNGTIDTTFNAVTGASTLDALALTASGNQLYIGGYNTSYHTYFSGIARLNSTGTLDNTFASTPGLGSVSAIAPLNDGSGRVWVGGSFSTYNGTNTGALVRILSSGALDSTFNSGETGINGTVSAILPLASGGALVAGSFHTYNGTTVGNIVQITTSGAINTSFNTGTGFDSSVYSLAMTTDGSNRVYVGYSGYSNSHYNGTVEPSGLVRLETNGSLDTGFSAVTGATSAMIYSILPLGDGSGQLYVGGFIQTTNAGDHIKLLTSTGSVSSSFNIGTGVNGNSVNTLVLSTDGTKSLYAGGNLWSYDGVTSSQLLRLTDTGEMQ